jgi:metal-responsive CopG/Arc/MetJ family transcriptional regulator
MLDQPEKTARLLAALKAAAPFEVELEPSLIEYLQTESVADADRMHHVVWNLSYAGDEGGIMCHLSRSEETGRALVVSLTHVRMPRSMPLTAAVVDYQKHRVKKLKKQRGM